MSFSGGTFTINTAGQPVVTGTTISNTAFNVLTADLATGLSTAVLKDGTQTVTANIPMATFKFTGLGAGTAATDSANLGQVAAGAYVWCGTAGGTQNALTLTPAPPITAYAAGQIFRFKSGATGSTSTVTVAVSGLATKAIQANGAALVSGEIAANQWYEILYDGAAFQLTPLTAVLPVANGGTGSTLTLPVANGGTGVTTGNNIMRIAAAGGTVDAITATFVPPATLTDKTVVHVVSAGANTSTTPSFAPDGLTAHAITARGGVALGVGDIGLVGFVMILEYNLANTRWELLNPVPAVLTAQTKLLITCDSSGGIATSYNVTSISDTATGVVTITIDHDFSGYYTLVVGPSLNSAAMITSHSRAGGSFILYSWSDAGIATDPILYDAVAFGAQV